MSDLLPCHLPSTLFTVRLWREAVGAEPSASCMQVKHVLSGETRYFREWAQLATYLEGKVQATKQLASSADENPNQASAGPRLAESNPPNGCLNHVLAEIERKAIYVTQ